MNFIKEKSHTFVVFEDLCQRLLREKDNVIRSNHGKKFENAMFFEFCANEGIFLGYSTNSRADKVFVTTRFSLELF